MATKTRRRRQQVLKGPHGGMQLVLTEDVQHLGKQGDVVEVRPGYARNYLLPRGMGTIPTEHNLRMLEHYKIRVKQAREARIADLKSMAEQISKMPGITIEANANDEGHLYGSVTGVEVSKALKGKNLKVEHDMVKLPGPVKLCGLYEVQLALGYDIETTVKVMVVPLKQSEKK